MIEKLTAINQKVSFLFVDYSKAFDTLSLVQLFQIMMEMDFPRHLVALLQGLYTDHKALIRWNNACTEEFALGSGIRQDCKPIISPKLFTLYTEQMRREAYIEDYGIAAAGHRISYLRYADDAVWRRISESVANR